MSHTRKILLTLPEPILNVIDAHAAAVSSNRSEFIRNLLRSALLNAPTFTATTTPKLAPVVPINATTATEPEEYTATVV